MKKLIYSIATLSMLLGGQTANAQLTFFESNNGIPSNFYVNGIVPVTSSEIYIAGAINNSPGWVPKIYKSNDGSNWNEVTVTGIAPSQLTYSAICYTGNKFLVATQGNDANEVYASSNGNSWSVSNNGIPSNFYVNGIVPVTSSEVYIAGAINNSPGWVPKIYKSNDGGSNWNEVTVIGIAPSQLTYSAICYTGNKFLVATQGNDVNEVYTSSNGNSWFVSNNGIPSNFYVNGIVPVTSSEIYIAGAINNSPGWVPKIYKSNDGGNNWNEITVSGINYSQSMYNSICYIGSKFLLATQGSGTNEVYASIDIVSSINQINKNEYIQKCFPNPANSEINLTYYLNDNVISIMKIYNFQGQLIEEKRIDSNDNKILLDISGYTRGIYFYEVNGVSSRFIVY